MLWLMLIVYVLNGQAYLTQKVEENKEICMMEGTEAVEKLMLDKPAASILIGSCVSIEGQKVEREK